MEALQLRPDGIYVDATFGRGGHSAGILERIGEGGRVIAIDRDPEAVASGRAMASADPRLRVWHAPFSALAEVVAAAGCGGRLNGVLFDLGVSSPQLDTAARGFSFQREGPLDMRMDTSTGETAAQWLARAEQGEIARVLREYGEERFAGRIAAAIVRRRVLEPLRTTLELAALIAAAVPARERDKHPATRSFQAIRIHLNRELQELEGALEQALEALASGGRLAVIAFHSLEDRMVKRFIRVHARGDDFPPDLPVPESALHPRLQAVGKAVRADAAEVAANPRARSAVLRVAEKRP